MVVAMFAVTAFVVLNETKAVGPSDPDERLPITQDMASSVLKAYSTMPAKNQSVWYSSQLEEWMVEAARDGHQEDLAWRFNELFRYGSHRLWLQSDVAMIPISGPPTGVLANTATSTHQYQAKWGVTLIQPGLSHYNPGNPVDLQVLPLFAGDALTDPSGIPYTTKVTLTDADQDTERISSHGRLRTPHPHEDDRGRDLRLTDITGNQEVHSVAPEDLPDLVDGQNWTLHIQIAPRADHHDGVWLDKTTTVRIQVPTGWSLEGHSDPANWTVTTSEPFVRMQYKGAKLRVDTAPDPIRFDVTLNNPDVQDLWRHQVVRVGLQGTQNTWRYQFLEPPTTRIAAPLGLYLGQPDPLPSGDHSEDLQIHVPNPHTSWRKIQHVEIDVPGHRHLFNRLKADWTPSDQNATYTTPNGTWTLHHNSATTDARFVWEGDLFIPPGKVGTIELPLRVDRNDGGPVPPFLVPLIEALDQQGNVTYQAGGHPFGPQGMHEYWIPGSLTPGQHQLRVPYAANERIPPGSGHYTVAPLSLGFLDDLQAARYSMGFDVEPRVHRHGEPLEISLETGILFDTLRGLDGFNADTLEVELRVSDLWGHFTDDPLLTQTWPLEIGATSAIVALEWIHANDDGTEDLLVAYEDGNLVALDGTDLPNTALWRTDVGGWITGGPIVLDKTDESTLVVAYRKGTSYRLAEYQQDGALISSKQITGEASHLVQIPCTDRPDIAFFMKGTQYGNSQRSINTAGNIEGSPEYRVTFWDGTVISGSTPVASLPHALRVGSFGPFAECSIVSGYENGLLHRFDAEKQTKEWELQLESTLRGLWVEDVRSLPIEDHTMPWWTGNRTDEVLVVTNDHGYEVWTGWLQEARQKPVPMPGILASDTLVGVSWVNATTGYAASEAGMVWKTEDGGKEWKVFATAIVEPPRTLIDFAFGGNGEGLFVRDNVEFRGFSDGQFSSPWRPAEDVGHEEFRGLSELATGPAVIYVRDGSLRMDPWDFTVHRPDELPASPSLPCACPHGTGGTWGLTGWDDNHLWVWSGDQWSKELEVARVAMAPSGFVITAQAGDIRLHNASADRLMAGWESWTSTFDSSKTARSSAGAALTTEPLILFADSSGPTLRKVDGSIRGVSAGPGPALSIVGGDLAPLESSQSLLRKIQMVAPPNPSEQVAVSVANAPADGEWRVISKSGSTLWKGLSEPHVFEWNPPSFVELRSVGGPALEVLMESVSLGGPGTLSSSSSNRCSDCLMAVASADSRGYGLGIGSSPAGILPSVHIPNLEADPVLIRNETGVPVVVVGNRGETLLVDARTGFALEDADLSHLSVDDAYQLLAVPGRSGEVDRLWAESGSEAAFDSAGTPGNLGFTGPSRAGLHDVRRISTATGDVLCTSSWSDGAAIGERRVLGGLGGADIFGTDRGHVRSTRLDCVADWATDPVTTGTRMAWSYTPPARTYGPQIVLATIRMDFEGQGTNELYLLGYSTSTANGSVTNAVYHLVGLSVWDNSGLY